MAPSINRPFACLLCQIRLSKSGRARPFATSRSNQHVARRPSTAPKASVDVKHIRQNPDVYSKNCLDRNYNSQSSSPNKIVALFEEWQAIQKNSRSLRERNNILQRELASGDSQDAAPRSREDLLEEAKGLKKQLSEVESKEGELDSEMQELGLELPNLTSAHTPIGDEPKILRYINDHPDPESSSSHRVWRSHAHIGSELQLLDFASSATTSGWGWYYLLNEAPKLEQALVGYACSVVEKRGWTTVSPPSIVYSHIAAACGFRPRDQHGEQQIYTLEQSDRDRRKPELSLAGTAEIALAGMKANQTLEEQDLPLKLVGPSRCYRAEAGARGVDTKGLYRVHEFTKVEMFAWALPAEVESVFDEMVSIQVEILESLGLHCRLLEMPSTDLGASASRKQDIEAYFPSRREKDDGWGEVTSASICTDYQSRRLATRVRLSKSGGKLDWPHTLNGTAMAVPRVLAALLENGWDEREGVVHLPPTLVPWLQGIDVIKRKHKAS
ncbi:MAG: Serine--tRNA ligase, mitochondrial [Sclerophora amabilis]|nr:MAG: Serine--tRNA ligase, mitochondrial [Sclerophora amabilis]